ncbi:hypothetical protein M0802_003966 [Mischocyttarus mexicanus]|nr:hypothetical protein M0802_003966 [Mischocyttarus mexicanus]
MICFNWLNALRLVESKEEEEEVEAAAGKKMNKNKKKKVDARIKVWKEGGTSTGNLRARPMQLTRIVANSHRRNAKKRKVGGSGGVFEGGKRGRRKRRSDTRNVNPWWKKPVNSVAKLPRWVESRIPKGRWAMGDGRGGIVMARDGGAAGRGGGGGGWVRGVHGRMPKKRRPDQSEPKVMHGRRFLRRPLHQTKK